MIRRNTTKRIVGIEPLESRRLMDATLPWGDTATLIHQDVAAAQHPDITGAGQSIAIIDTGIDYTQAALGGGFGAGHKVVGGWDFVDNDADPIDTFGHGTNVAGIIGAAGFDYNGFHYQGIAPGANLVALRVDAADNPVPDDRIAAALQWVLDHRTEFNITAVNISLGDGLYDTAHTSTYSGELAQLKTDGVMVFAASGNDGLGTDPGIEYPAADPSVFSVGAVDSFDRVTEFTSRGHNLDFLAPGANMPTVSEGPNAYEVVSGTSFASPLVAGLSVLAREANPDLTVADLTSLLKSSSVTNLDGDNEFGNVTHLKFPRVDVANTLSLALAWKPGPLASSGVIARSTNLSMTYDDDGVLHLVYYDPKLQTLQYCVRLNKDLLSAPQTVDTTGDNVGQYVSLAIDKEGRPGIAYFDGSKGDLRYAHFNGATWDVSTIDANGSCGLYPSLAYTSDDHALISYYHKTNTALRLAEFDGTGWTLTYIDTPRDVGRSTSLAISPAGDVAIAYEQSTRGILKIARKTASGWKISVADNTSRGVAFISLAFDPQNQPAISYYNGGPADLKYTEFDGKTWHPVTLSRKGAQGQYTQLYFNKSGNPNILYYSRKSNLLVQASRTDNNTWTAQVLQTGGGKYLELAIDPATSDLTYAWYRTSDGKLLFGELDLT